MNKREEIFIFLAPPRGLRHDMAFSSWQQSNLESGNSNKHPEGLLVSSVPRRQRRRWCPANSVMLSAASWCRRWITGIINQLLEEGWSREGDTRCFWTKREWDWMVQVSEKCRDRDRGGNMTKALRLFWFSLGGTVDLVDGAGKARRSLVWIPVEDRGAFGVEIACSPCVHVDFPQISSTLLFPSSVATVQLKLTSGLVPNDHLPACLSIPPCCQYIIMSHICINNSVHVPFGCTNVCAKSYCELTFLQNFAQLLPLWTVINVIK